MRTPDGARWRLLVSDLDGTLVTGTTALQHLRDWMGRGPALEGVGERLALGGVSDREVAEAHAPSYRGIAVADAVEAMASIPSVGGIAEGVALLQQRSVDACIATVSWRFAAQALADRAGFTHVCGAELEVDGRGSFTGRVARHFAPEDKVAFVSEHCRRAGFGLDRVVAVGDGRSDLPLFRAVGFSVALNASSEARAAASAVVDGDSFLAALQAVPGLLDEGRHDRAGPGCRRGTPG